MGQEITIDEAGKRVIDSDGNEIGVVVDVDTDEDTAYVDPDQEQLAGELKTRLGWGSDAQSKYPLRNDAISTVTENAIQLRNEY
ncbi:hypothetical protein [Natronolimnohabitans innermongolicus]|uniref:PRC-barrel domain-containing protein n=1 Tax=Natronolimnohabitans innermongolicus JCM 12255 TaxID=1227499 RepID=L9X211_9EURY|nr:hypothetical protein [Natronolimnohabitans innermongolicus]ELY55765.1 hypothetical protein C493_10882 [Natronolimnohabitans innermongolicus JCM 12255]